MDLRSFDWDWNRTYLFDLLKKTKYLSHLTSSLRVKAEPLRISASNLHWQKLESLYYRMLTRKMAIDNRTCVSLKSRYSTWEKLYT